jgi:hypothetical protein
MVLVTWRDAVHGHGWIDDDEKDAEFEDVCLSIGWVIKVTKTSIKLAQTVGKNDDEIAQTVQIPSSMLLSIQDLAVSTEKEHGHTPQP